MAAPWSYQEPGTVTILLDRAIYCGLVGQIFVGAAWGTAGGKLFGAETENVISQLGYLGMILLVYEGCSSFLPR